MRPADFDPLNLTRRHFLLRTTMGVGATALARSLPDALASGLAKDCPAAGAGGFRNSASVARPQYVQ